MLVHVRLRAFSRSFSFDPHTAGYVDAGGDELSV